MQFKNFFALASFAVLSLAQTTPAQIESDISNGLTPALAAGIAVVDAFPVDGGTLDQAMAIHTAIVNINSIVVTITNDIQTASCPLADSDASAILALLEGQGANIQKALMDLTTREPGIEAVGAAPLIAEDLSVVQASSDAMGAALVGCVSSNIAPEAQAFQSAVDAAFAPAVAAFN